MCGRATVIFNVVFDEQRAFMMASAVFSAWSSLKTILHNVYKQARPQRTETNVQYRHVRHFSLLKGAIRVPVAANIQYCP